MDGHLVYRIKENRKLNEIEKTWFHKLFRVDFEGKNILIEQLREATVVGYCGCKTIDIDVKKTIKEFPFQIRVPVEMIAIQDDGMPIMFNLHVINGYINELEVFKMDSSPIDYEINLERTTISINEKLY